jgi:hypothetical protein
LYPWNHHVKWGVSVLIIMVRTVCIFIARVRDISPLTMPFFPLLFMYYFRPLNAFSDTFIIS